MEKISRALERAKMLVGMDVDEEAAQEEASSSSFFDDFNRQCTLSTQQVVHLNSLSDDFGAPIRYFVF